MNLIKLRRTLIRCLDENELRDLCFDLGVDYESLRGEGKAAKVRELIAHLELEAGRTDPTTADELIDAALLLEAEYGCLEGREGSVRTGAAVAIRRAPAPK